MVQILQNNFTERTLTDERIQRLIESIQNLFADLTEETHLLIERNEEIPFIHALLEHLKSVLDETSTSSSNLIPSVLHGFLEARFLSYLYKFAMKEVTVKRPADIDGLQCPLDRLTEPASPRMAAFEILLRVCFQATFDQPYSLKSILFHAGLKEYQSSINCSFVYSKNGSLFIWKNCPCPIRSPSSISTGFSLI